MVSKPFSVSSLAGLSLLSLNLYANEASVDLLEIYNQALNNDAEISAAQATLKATQELPKQGRAALLPNISVAANAGRTRLAADGMPNSSYNSNDWSASLVQPLFKLDSWYNYSKTKVISEQAAAQFSLAQQDLILRTANAYFDVLRAKDTLATTTSEEKAVKRQLDQTKQRYEVGLIAQTDVHEAQAAYDAARVSLIVAENNLDVSYEALRTLTNTDHRTIASLNKQMPVNTPVPNDQQAWVETATAQNFSIKVAELSVKTAQKEVKVQKSGHAPSVNAVFSYGQERNPANYPLTSNHLRSSYAGVQFSMPIYSGGATNSAVRQSNYSLQATQDQLTLAKRQTSQNTRNLFRTVNADAQRISARMQGIVSATSALEATESGYEVGTRNVVDVLNAQRTLFASQRDYLNARYDFIINTLLLKQQAGTLSPQDLQELNQWISASDTALLPSS